MCKYCHPPPEPHYEGKRVILEPGRCDCLDCSVTEMSNPPRCVKCGHILPIKLTTDADSWEENPLWIDPVTKHPIRRDEVKK